MNPYIRPRIVRFDSLASTNQYCELLDLTQVEEFTVYCAREQTAGIGQRGNHWDAAPGANLTFSVVLKPVHLPVAEQYQITKMVSLGVADALQRQLPSQRVQIKWPNDIYVGREKICGILISNKIQGSRIVASIVGIGLNVNQTRFADWVPNPTSLRLLTGREYPLGPLLEEVVAAIAERYRGGDAPQLDADYLSRLMNLGVPARYEYEGHEIVATITGVNRFGHLQLRTPSGECLSCQMKEIRLVL